MDLKVFNFSNCSEPSQVILRNIFTDDREEGPTRLSAETSCVSLSCGTRLHHFTIRSKTKAWTKQRTGHGRSLWQALCPHPSRSREASLNTSDSPANKVHPVLQKVKPPPSLCQSGLGEAPFAPRVSQGLWSWTKWHRVSSPRHLQQKCFGAQTSSHSKRCLLLSVVSQPSGKSKARKQTLLLTPKAWKHTKTCLVSRTPKRNTLLIPAGN